MITDIIIGFFLIIYLWEGWNSGLLKTLIGPVCAMLCCLLAFLYFDLTDNIIIAFFVAVFGSIILMIVVAVLFTLWRKKTVDQKYRATFFPGSRVAGATVNLAWLGGITIAAFLFFALIPTSLQKVQKMQKDIKQSNICEWTSENIFARIPLTRQIFSVLSIFKDRQRLDEITESKEFQTFLADPKLEAISQDPDIISLYEKNKIVALLVHPKITGLLGDNRLMQKLTHVVKMIATGKQQQPAPVFPGPGR